MISSVLTDPLSKTSSSLLTFFLAMALYPESQKKAQAELDAVVGSARLPNFDDRNVLPYVNAIIKETLRWQNVGPIGMHVSLIVLFSPSLSIPI